MFSKTSRPESSETPVSDVNAEAVLNEESAQEEAQPQDTQATGDSVEAWQGKYQLLQEQFTRLAADFDNYRKRTRDEQESLVKYGAQKSIMELLPVLDNLERANGSLNEDSDPNQLYKSFSMMQKQLLDGLANMGIQKIQSVGQPFDPQLHEAVNQMESAEFPEDTIMYEAQSGYQLHDKVIRPAMVVVSTGSGEATAAPVTDESEVAEKPHNPFVK
jgi:molecular chaperone GrpE